MKNKKRISKLISKKNKASRKITFFKHHKMGWDFGVQFQDKLKKYIEINIKDYSSKDWEKEYMNVPVTRLDPPLIKKRIKNLEQEMRNIPVNSIEFLNKATELKAARIEFQYLIAERNNFFEDDNGLINILRSIRVPNITKHLL